MNPNVLKSENSAISIRQVREQYRVPDPSSGSPQAQQRFSKRTPSQSPLLIALTSAFFGGALEHPSPTFSGISASPECLPASPKVANKRTPSKSAKNSAC